MQDEVTTPLNGEETIKEQDAELEAMNGDEATTEAAQTAETEPQKVENTETADALAAALAKQEEYLTMAQRVQADFDNYRRRNQNLRKEAFDDGARAFGVTLLPVLDNLERAITAAQNSSDASLKEGVEMVCRQLIDAFSKRGITEIECLHQPFDPNLENAVMQGTSDDGDPGTVCEVLQKGYQMENVVLRHAMVKVVPEN
ncbi:MAG: nucleotide exchange factor GrpE [Eubacteriales bacterium]|nr:nucleotide exchange factor GrpE [Eubacteriales bacterium]